MHAVCFTLGSWEIDFGVDYSNHKSFNISKNTLLISLLLVQCVRALAWRAAVRINCTQSEKFDGSQSYKCCLCVVFEQVALLFFTASFDRGFSRCSTCQLLVHLAGFQYILLVSCTP